MACISEISDGRPHWMRGWADPASLTSPVKEPSDEEDRGYDHDPRDMNRTGDFANEYPDLLVGHDNSGFWIGFIGGLPNAAVQACRAERAGPSARRNPALPEADGSPRRRPNPLRRLSFL